MQNAVWLFSIVITLAMFVAQPRWGGLAFILVAMLAPYGMFADGEFSMRADLVLTPLMLGCQLLGLSRTTNRYSLVPIAWLFVAWLACICTTTLVSEQKVDLIGAYGYVRLVLVMIIFSWIPWRELDASRFQFAYVLISIPIGLLSIGQVLDISFARALSNSCYSPPGADVMARQVEAEQIGYLYRAVGVFGNVSPTATYFLLTICLALSLLSTPIAHKRRCWLALALATSLSGGLATLSGTFVGGIALVMLVALFNSDRKHRRNIILAVVCSVAMLAIIVAIARSQFAMVDAQLDYQWQRIVNGHLLTNRYSTSEGILADAIEDLYCHPMFGLGWTATDVFSGDSTYFSILYCSGIVGGLVFAAGLVRLVLSSFRGKQCGRWALSWTAIMLLGGIGCSSLILGRLADGWWAMQGMLICQLAATQTQNRLISRGSALAQSNAIQRFGRFNVGRPVYPLTPSARTRRGSTT